MSRSRSVGGVPATSGRKPLKDDPLFWKKKDFETLRTGSADVGVRKTVSTHRPTKKRVSKQRKKMDHERYARLMNAIARHGTIKKAVAMEDELKMSYGQARNLFWRRRKRKIGDKITRASLKTSYSVAKGEHTFRQMERCAKGLEASVKLSPKLCRSVLMWVQGRMEMLATEGGLE